MTDPGSDPLHVYREAVKEHELAADRLSGLRSTQRIYLVMTTVGGLLSLLLAYSVVVGLWDQQPVITRYISLLAVLILAVAGGTLAWRNRPTITGEDLNVRNLAHDKQTAAADLPLESDKALRIYRESSLDLVDNFRTRATRNRRVHNLIQAIIIVASILASTASALTGELPDLRWAATILSVSVSVAAGLTAYFKFRERGHGFQATADEIEKHYTAAQFKLDDFAQDVDESSRLLRFARYVEKLKEEQRKRELQLEQSPDKSDDRG